MNILYTLIFCILILIHNTQILLSAFSDTKIGSILPTTDPLTTLYLSPPSTQYFQKALDFLFESIVLLQLQDVSEGHLFQLFSVFSRSPSALLKYLMSNDAGSSLGKEAVLFPSSLHTHDLLLRPNKNSFAAYFYTRDNCSLRTMLRQWTYFMEPRY